MARRAREITCSAEEERILRNIASSRTATFSEVLRAKIILYSLQGMPLSHIAKILNVSLTIAKVLLTFIAGDDLHFTLKSSERRY